MLLAGYRVLDLTDERGLLCGRLLADLGAEVIAVEPPGGSPARRAGPFLDGAEGPSLFWWAYASGKKGITLDITTPTGRDLFLRLVAVSDAVLESFPPGHLENLGLGYEALRKANPSLVLTSITPFGQEGPYAHFQATDLIVSALGGMTFVTGDPDRPPVRVGFPQSFLLASAAAALGTTLALFHRTRTGEGQRVDTSAQEAVARTLDRNFPFWDFAGMVVSRTGCFGRPGGGPLRRLTFRCRDGFVNYMVVAGAVGAGSMQGLISWMDEVGFDSSPIKEVPWEDLDFTNIPQDVLQRTEDVLQRFFATRTKEELWEGAQRRRLLLYPVATPGEVARWGMEMRSGLFQKVESREAGRPLLSLSPFLDLGEASSPRPAPAPGEHNAPVYEGLLGLSPEEVETLRWGGVI